MAMLDKVKAACRITSTAYDDELTDLIAAAKLDLTISGVVHDDLDLDTDADADGEEGADPLIRRAIITYCRANLGSPDDYDRLKAAYDAQKGLLSMATGYTDWDTEEEDDDE